MPTVGKRTVITTYQGRPLGVGGHWTGHGTGHCLYQSLFSGFILIRRGATGKANINCGNLCHQTTSPVRQRAKVIQSAPQSAPICCLLVRRFDAYLGDYIACFKPNWASFGLAIFFIYIRVFVKPRGGDAII